MKKNTFFGLIGIIGMLLANSCYYDDEEYLYPMTGCDTSNVTYQLTIAPLMESRCNTCHGAVNPSAGIVTANWEGLSTIALDGRLWGAVNRETGYSPMPKDQDKLPDCDLLKIRVWIDGGAKND